MGCGQRRGDRSRGRGGSERSWCGWQQVTCRPCRRRSRCHLPKSPRTETQSSSCCPWLSGSPAPQSLPAAAEAQGPWPSSPRPPAPLLLEDAMGISERSSRLPVRFPAPSPSVVLPSPCPLSYASLTAFFWTFSSSATSFLCHPKPHAEASPAEASPTPSGVRGAGHSRVPGTLPCEGCVAQPRRSPPQHCRCPGLHPQLAQRLLSHDCF